MGWRTIVSKADVRDRHERNVDLVAEGIKRWRLQYDPADDHGPTMAEYLVALLEQEGRL